VVSLAAGSKPYRRGSAFPPSESLLSNGIKLRRTGFNLVWISGAGPQSDSFEDLAMPLFDQLYNFARWLTQNREEAEDLVQETYTKALKGFSSFQLGTNFRAWMYRILRNTFLTSRTGLRAASTVSLDSEEDGPELAVENETPETILTRSSHSQLVQSAIDDLPVHYRETLLLCDVEEMSYREIAETLSIPIGTVMSRLSRARHTLRDHLGARPRNVVHRVLFVVSVVGRKHEMGLL
jgi:RNA polymerase sigma-70 factor (ECF subfamily)